MIISSLEFYAQNSAIKDILFGPELTLKNRKLKLQDHVPDCEYLNSWYEENFISFPLRTEETSDFVSINSTFLQNYNVYLHNQMEKSPLRSLSDINEKIEQADDESLRFDIIDFIEERVANLLYCFPTALKRIKKSYIFAGISSETAILRELLAFYKGLRTNENVQLHFFTYLHLPKKISDVMVDVLIYILEDKLRILGEDVLSDKTMPIFVNGFKLDWLASQQDFVELILALKTKGYLAFSENKPAIAIAKNLSSMFDFSASQRKASSDVAANIHKHLKPTFDRDVKKERYFYQYNNYERKFETIIQNPKILTPPDSEMPVKIKP